MMMLAAYNGQIRNGQPVFFDSVVLPENASVVLTVEMPTAKTNARRQGEAIKRIMSAIDADDGSMFTEADFFELENNRANIGREVKN
jgi:hypothetical protein